MTAAKNPSGAALPKAAAPEATSHRTPWFIHEVEAILTAALLRDDDRQPHRCPMCGQRAADKGRT